MAPQGLSGLAQDDRAALAERAYPRSTTRIRSTTRRPVTKAPLGSLDEVDPKLLETYTKLGIPLTEQKILSGVAVDAIFDSVSVGTS